MALDLNISPYYDDFSEEKNYHKILFKHFSYVGFQGALQMFKEFRILFLQKYISMGILWFNSFAVYQCCQSFYIT